MDPLPDKERFGLLVANSLRSLPASIQANLTRYGVSLLVEDASPIGLRTRTSCGAVYATYEGPRVTESPQLAGRRITVYRRDTCQAARDMAHLTAWLPQLLDHEYQHFLGHDHADMGTPEPTPDIPIIYHELPSGYFIRSPDANQGQHAEAPIRATKIHVQSRTCERCGSIAERRTIGATDQSQNVGHVDACESCEHDSWKFYTHSSTADKVRRLRGKHVT